MRQWEDKEGKYILDYYFALSIVELNKNLVMLVQNPGEDDVKVRLTSGGKS